MNIEKTLLVIVVLAIFYLYIGRPRSLQAINWNRKKLQKFLQMNHIPYNRWKNPKVGQKQEGASTMFDNLLESLQNGEMWVEEDSMKRRPALHMNVAVITVNHCHNGHKETLREFRRTEKDAEYKKRPFTGSLGGKIKLRSEMPEDAAFRLLENVLGFKDASEFILGKNGLEIVEGGTSLFYLGFVDVYHRYHFIVNLEANSLLYRHKYVFIEDGHETHFCWQKDSTNTV